MVLSRWCNNHNREPHSQPLHRLPQSLINSGVEVGLLLNQTPALALKRKPASQFKVVVAGCHLNVYTARPQSFGSSPIWSQ